MEIIEKPNLHSKFRHYDTLLKWGEWGKKVPLRQGIHESLYYKLIISVQYAICVKIFY